MVRTVFCHNAEERCITKGFYVQNPFFAGGRNEHRRVCGRCGLCRARDGHFVRCRRDWPYYAAIELSRYIDWQTVR